MPVAPLLQLRWEITRGGNKREELRQAEIELMRRRERVAELRRRLPQAPLFRTISLKKARTT
jgi:predicted dithiol-disulfide oxidoreductase (DUF899 family)